MSQAQGTPPLTLESAGRLQGTSDAMRALISRVRCFATSSMNVLILGETGSGKELCAEAIHKLSALHHRPWVAVNCGALPDSLLMAELFGCRAGAFTNAQERQGLILSAHQGTLFLDEIGELSLEAQAALLRVLDQGEVRPLGSDRVHRVKLRLICATHRDLDKLIQEGKFRADLYHRISTVALSIPALRQRLEDLPLIVSDLSLSVAMRLTQAAWRSLAAYPWPGNIRELKNLTMRLEHEYPEGPLEPHQLELVDDLVLRPREEKYLISGCPPPSTSNPTPPHLFPPSPEPPHSPSAKTNAAPLMDDPFKVFRTDSSTRELETLETLVKRLPEVSLASLKQTYIEQTVLKLNGNISLAARILRISRGQIYRNLEREPENLAA